MVVAVVAEGWTGYVHLNNCMLPSHVLGHSQERTRNIKRTMVGKLCIERRGFMGWGARGWLPTTRATPVIRTQNFNAPLAESVTMQRLVVRTPKW